MILIQHTKAALVLNTDLKWGQILNGSNWTGLNSTLSRSTGEAPWTQNKAQMASKPGRTSSLTRRASIFHRCFLDNSVQKTTHTWTEHAKCSRHFPAPLLSCLTKSLFQVRRNYPKEEKLSSNPVWKDTCNTSPASMCQPCFSCHAPLALWLTLIQGILFCCPHTWLEASWKPVLLLHSSLVCSMVFSSTSSSREKGAEIIGILKAGKSDGVFSRVFSLLNQKL